MTIDTSRHRPAKHRMPKSQNVGVAERIGSIVAGAFFVYLGLGKNKKLATRAKRIGTGAVFLYRGFSGICPAYSALGVNSKTNAPHVLTVEAVVVINRPRQEVYRCWRDLEKWPDFMQHVSDVLILSEYQSRWKAHIPGTQSTLQWDIAIIDERENDLFAWRSLPGSEVDTAGEIFFSDVEAASGISTEVRINISFAPLADDENREEVADLLDSNFKKIVKNDLFEAKHYIEAQSNTYASIRHELSLAH